MGTHRVIAIGIVSAFVAAAFRCGGTGGNAGPSSPPVLLSSWYGQILNVYQQRVGDTVDHTLCLVFWDDSTYAIDDSMRIHTGGAVMYVPVEKGAWSIADSVYTFRPSRCVDQNTGEFSAAACATESYTGTERDSVFIIPQFLNEPIDLVLTRR